VLCRCQTCSTSPTCGPAQPRSTCQTWRTSTGALMSVVWLRACLHHLAVACWIWGCGFGQPRSTCQTWRTSTGADAFVRLLLRVMLWTVRSCNNSWFCWAAGGVSRLVYCQTWRTSTGAPMSVVWLRACLHHLAVACWIWGCGFGQPRSTCQTWRTSTGETPFVLTL
jgi:hypothetical protein